MARTAVVDQLSVRVEPRIGADTELVAIAQRILDGVLIGRVLETLQPASAEPVAVLQPLESSGCVGLGDVIAELANFPRGETVSRRLSGQAEVFAKPLGHRVGMIGRVPGARSVGDVDVQVGCRRILGVDEVYEDAVAGEQGLAVVEGQICCQLGLFPDLRDVFGGDGAVEGDVHLDGGHGYGAARSVGVAAEVVGGLGIRGAVGGYGGGAAVFGWLGAVPLSGLADLLSLMQFARGRGGRLVGSLLGDGDIGVGGCPRGRTVDRRTVLWRGPGLVRRGLLRMRRRLLRVRYGLLGVRAWLLRVRWGLLGVRIRLHRLRIRCGGAGLGCACILRGRYVLHGVGVRCGQIQGDVRGGFLRDRGRVGSVRCRLHWGCIRMHGSRVREVRDRLHRRGFGVRQR